MKGNAVFLIGIAVAGIIACNMKQRDPNTRTYEDSYEASPTTPTSSPSSTVTQTPQRKVEESPFINNSLSTGTRAYPAPGAFADDESQISVSTSFQSNCDVVVIIKSGGAIVEDVYIKAGGDYTFHLRNGRYQVFFYGGKGWNPNKRMPGGYYGGFVANESYSKDSPVTLESQGLTYSLTLQENGNFSTQQSSASEIF